ncbi:MAG: ester cyclase [Formosimonas sp.]
MSTPQQLVQTFYNMLTTPAQKDVQALAESVIAEDWQSIDTQGGTAKTRAQFIQQVIGFGKLIPDLNWAVQEIIEADNKIVVRSQVSGTPATDFMGTPHTGKSFSIMTIDIHTVKDNQLSVAHHVENWMSAVMQLKA